MKVCTKCEEERSLDRFRVNSANKFTSVCKDCVNKSYRERWKIKGKSITRSRCIKKKISKDNFVNIDSSQFMSCYYCKQSKQKSEFAPSGWACRCCKSCIKIINRSYRSSHISELKQRQKNRYENGLKDKTIQNNRSRRALLRAVVAEMKSKPCTDCGKNFKWYVMEYDHIKQKKYQISSMVNRGWTIKRIKLELENCELVCSCCHRSRSKSRFPTPGSYGKLQTYKRTYIDKCKSKPCVDCDQTFLPHQMDFDHVNGEKLGILSQMYRKDMMAINAEIDKCEVVCANCHKVRTYERKQHLNIIFQPLIRS